MRTFPLTFSRMAGSRDIPTFQIRRWMAVYGRDVEDRFGIGASEITSQNVKR
jgi:hypothetical protein